MRRDPGFDRGGPRAAAEAVRAPPHVVMDLVPGDHRLELGEGGRRVGAVEAADRDHGESACRQFDRRRLLGPLGRGDPAVLAGILLEQLDQAAAHLRAAGEPAAAETAEAAATPAAEVAAARECAAAEPFGETPAREARERPVTGAAVAVPCAGTRSSPAAGEGSATREGSAAGESAAAGERP